MNQPAFKSWTPETFEQTGETPQDALREVETEALVQKYSQDWLVMLFSPLGVKEILEIEIQLLMRHLNQPYDAVMGMPCSRRKRMMEKVDRYLKSK